MNTRAQAAAILAEVVGEGTFLTFALDQAIPQIPQENDRAFVRALCYGVMRWYWRLDRILSMLTHKPIRDYEIRMLALLGIYQLTYTRVKPHAAVAETVEAAGSKSWAKPLLNGILRSYQRERAHLEPAIDRHEPSASAHPDWLVGMLRKNWPDRYANLLAQNNLAPPLALRIHLGRISREDYLARLAEAGLPATPSDMCASAVIVDNPVPVEKLPGFAEGWVSVQDTAAQLAAPLLDLAPGQRVLDVCAAPGGKTLHILESCPDLQEVVAVDIAPERTAKITENLNRAGLAATVITADATRPDTWWDGRWFDRILVDAPCSATGVIRRHPDIKVLRQPDDIAELTETQSRILTAAWSMLAPGGVLVYATCSVLRRENEQRIGEFLATHDDAQELSIDAEWGLAAGHGRQILTGDHGMDGFYYARLRKLAP